MQKDIKLTQSSPIHLSLSASGESTVPHTSATNLESCKVSFKWNQVLRMLLLRTSRSNEHVHKDMIDECRRIYFKNKTVNQIIDEFDKTYKSHKCYFMVYTRFICLQNC